MKLLLDAPEHLWRLMERKVYLNAAWLFLLARVVHRALSQDDEEQSWHAYGIDVAVSMSMFYHIAFLRIHASNEGASTPCATTVGFHYTFPLANIA